MAELVRPIKEEKLVQRKCPRHPNYRGLNKPREGSPSSQCDVCLAILSYNRSVGIRGRRPNSKRKGVPLKRKGQQMNKDTYEDGLA